MGGSIRRRAREAIPGRPSQDDRPASQPASHTENARHVTPTRRLMSQRRLRTTRAGGWKGWPASCPRRNVARARKHPRGGLLGWPIWSPGRCAATHDLMQPPLGGRAALARGMCLLLQLPEFQGWPRAARTLQAWLGGHPPPPPPSLALAPKTRTFFAYEPLLPPSRPCEGVSPSPRFFLEHHPPPWLPCWSCLGMV